MAWNDDEPRSVDIAGSDMHLHIHNEVSPDTGLFHRRIYRILQRHQELLERIIFGMADIQAATENLTQEVSLMASRVNEDVNHLQDLLNEALVTNSNDAAEVARIKADAESAVARINEVTNAVRNIDPLTTFPSPRPSESEPPVAVPGDEPRGDGPIRPDGGTPPNETLPIEPAPVVDEANPQ
jgi:hypothetical protein